MSDTKGPWVCTKGVSVHDFYISQRRTTTNFAFLLLNELSESSFQDRPVHSFLPHTCMKWKGVDVNLQYVEGIRHSSVVVLLIAEADMKRIQIMTEEEKLFLDWEHAVDLMDQFQAVVQPVFVGTVAERMRKKSDVQSFPNTLHNSDLSPRKYTIRQIVQRIFSLTPIFVASQKLEIAKRIVPGLIETLGRATQSNLPRNETAKSILIVRSVVGEEREESSAVVRFTNSTDVAKISVDDMDVDRRVNDAGCLVFVFSLSDSKSLWKLLSVVMKYRNKIEAAEKAGSKPDIAPFLVVGTDATDSRRFISTERAHQFLQGLGPEIVTFIEVDQATGKGMDLVRQLSCRIAAGELATIRKEIESGITLPIYAMKNMLADTTERPALPMPARTGPPPVPPKPASMSGPRPPDPVESEPAAESPSMGRSRSRPGSGARPQLEPVSMSRTKSKPVPMSRTKSHSKSQSPSPYSDSIPPPVPPKPTTFITPTDNEAEAPLPPPPATLSAESRTSNLNKIVELADNIEEPTIEEQKNALENADQDIEDMENSASTNDEDQDEDPLAAKDIISVAVVVSRDNVETALGLTQQLQQAQAADPFAEYSFTFHPSWSLGSKEPSFLDVEAIHKGIEFDASLIRAADAVIPLVSASFMADSVCTKCLVYANLHRKKIVPCLLESDDGSIDQMSGATDFILSGSLYYRIKSPASPTVIKSIQDAIAVKESWKAVDYVFLSYSWSTQSFVIRVNAELQLRGFQTWMDLDQMRGQIYDQMATGIDGSKGIVSFINNKYVESDNCRGELTYARIKRKPIIATWIQTDLALQKSWIGPVVATRVGEVHVNDADKIASAEFDQFIKRLVDYIQNILGLLPSQHGDVLDLGN
ncbi:uncharacterized protein BJ171DRAFT_597727 [Polychytrium aggregatum]|uniref:uncharacterized protein n=1 Tax=Polychytrium aggregatum TaxID=110093 RepID=UPI0022FE9399|nr:uncharacterized protein BJ171DRAFT_597727 [Polychytrium aggregatum]KAI9206043.1 hypothetical protein BJ171DRAFT_597727 [Polychytrium aggregatum]